MEWLDLLAVQGTLKSLHQHHSSKASILQCSVFFTVQLSHPYMITGKSIALTRWTFVGKVMSLLLDMLSRLVIAFLPRSKCLLISWLQSPSTVIWNPQNKVCHCFHYFPIYLTWSDETSFPNGSVVKNPPKMQETWVWPLGLEDPLEKEMATHSIILVWEIPWTEDPGRPLFKGLQN